MQGVALQSALRFDLSEPTVIKQARYWRRLQESPGYDHHAFHDANLSGSQLSRCFPWMIHEDGGEVYNSVSYSMWHWFSGMADHRGTSTLDGFFMICMIEEDLKTDETEEDIVEYLEYNDRVMEAGVFPHAG